ncbi:thioesterase [Notoacmeibacter marinus]|uniref:Medium/long-chain acyl-CoA thioesterase YigI n=1 Tax=Notoacmeibacter marinus TaxID=1876515 RepID=A0A231V2G7_9HYPH|nr:PaaI family thioesterase [Notoacmeibacter marinus]OXT02378.1 thioesterase [Notoacmeibacter marinus]
MDSEANVILDFARAIFDAQPFTQFLTAELVSASREAVTIRLPIRREILQQHGFVHGGAISYLADNAITFAGGIALNGDALTSEFKVNYLRPAKGTALIARAAVRSSGRRQAVCQCDIFVEDDEDKPVAVAQGTVVPVG